MKNKLKPITRISAWIIVFAMLLGGCASRITSGEVYRKEYIPEHTSMTMIPVVTYNGKTTSTTLVPRTIHENERYVIYIKEFDGEKWQTENFYVSPEVYDAVKIGDIFDYDDTRGDLIEEPYTKQRLEE